VGAIRTACAHKYRRAEVEKSRKARRLASALLAAILLAIPVSCRGGRPERIVLPSTPVLSIRSTWAVVKSPLLRVRAEPSNKSEVLSHVRIGVAVEIIARSDNEDTLENEVAYWYRINYDGLKGWVFGSYLEIFDSRSLAEKYAEKLQ
jgi:uncharacterized protein YgiM (DUF1202 family)